MKNIADNKLFLPVLEGTTREKRRSINVANLIVKIINDLYSDSVETQLVDPVDFDFPGDGNDPEGKDPRYTEITERADGLFVVVPEYNHSFPGSLKRMLDSELKNYIHKPVAFAGVSSSMMGGARGIESLVPSVREMGLVATFTDVYFPRVQDLFDEDGNLTDEAYIDRVKKSLDELIWMANALKTAREKESQS